MTSAGKARQVQGVGGRMYALCHKKNDGLCQKQLAVVV